jgi:hypothetical protein
MSDYTRTAGLYRTLEERKSVNCAARFTFMRRASEVWLSAARKRGLLCGPSSYAG